MNMKDFNLDNEPKIGTGFKTPEGYFDAFQQKMMENLPVEEPKVISIFARNRKWILSAAAVFVVALTIPTFYNSASNEDEIDVASMENYLAYQSNISQYDLINLLDNEDIQSLDVDFALEDQTIEDILTTNTNLENYLYEN